ncbi:MAG: matrixin family metalloprotease [Pirellulales bacterium]
MKQSQGVGREVRRAVTAGLACLALAILSPRAQAEYVTFSDGWGSKWDHPAYGMPAVVTWSYMTDGTIVDPALDNNIKNEVSGGSNITQMRADFDASYGSGAFDTAIQNAMNTWAAAAPITFVGPVTDPNLPVGDPGAATVDIRIGAFTAVPGSGFSFVGAVGYGPPGNDELFPDSLAGDIMFNIDAGFLVKPGLEDDSVDPLGNDLENLTLHELGHAAIGLGHPDSGPGDVMYVGEGCCDFINRELSVDDIAGARFVYGPYHPGDANGDGHVDGLDYLTWAAFYGDDPAEYFPGSPRNGDLNNDDVVDGLDYLLWAGNFHAGPNDSLAVPEPGVAALLLTAVCVWPRQRRRRATAC